MSPPRSVAGHHGQVYMQNAQQHGNQGGASGGRPIVKGSNQTSPLHQPRLNVPQQNMMQGKNLNVPSSIANSMGMHTASPIPSQADINKILEQHRLMQQRQLNASPLPQRSVAIVPPQPIVPQQQLGGPGSSMTPAHAAMLLRNMMNPTAIRQVQQLATAQHMRTQGPMDPRLRGLNPLALQQLQMQLQQVPMSLQKCCFIGTLVSI